ncbi:MAG: hypothetical protein IJU76_13540, partial [Desulfovibrionaceae bacterium]|nr:hypothetical protein [Desulfovibrionaceae bacterium]
MPKPHSLACGNTFWMTLRSKNLSDAHFKGKIFSLPSIICKSFANAVLSDLQFNPIPDFTLTSPVFSPVTYNAKATYFDVQGMTSNLDQIDFEIQRR